MWQTASGVMEGGHRLPGGEALRQPMETGERFESRYVVQYLQEVLGVDPKTAYEALEYLRRFRLREQGL